MVFLEIRTGSRSRRVHLDEGTWLVGRAHHCDVVLADPSVSRQHFQIRIGPEGVEVEDLGSRHGLWLDGFRVQVAELPLGRWFLAGKVALQVHHGTTDDRDPAAIPPRKAAPEP